MFKNEAILNARRDSKKHGVAIVVYFDKYDESTTDAEKYGYCPVDALTTLAPHATPKDVVTILRP
jgi:hypothetical protein